MEETDPLVVGTSLGIHMQIAVGAKKELYFKLLRLIGASL